MVILSKYVPALERRTGRAWRSLALLLYMLSGQAFAQDVAAEFQIKAAFLHKFPIYVQGAGTPFDDTQAPLVFGVAGAENVYTVLAELVATQHTDMRGAEVRQISEVADMAGVNVLFVGQEAAIDVDALMQQAVAGSMLTVSDIVGTRPENCMIHFFVADDRVRFDIALAPAETAGLHLSSRLLQVAREVVAAEEAPE